MNSALNYGLGHVKGDLVLLTDDDAIPSGNWLRAMVNGASKYPREVIFGGQIFPQFTSDVPSHIECQ